MTTTVIDQVLEAEHAATEAIKDAEKEAAEAVSVARAKKAQAIELESDRLIKKEHEELVLHDAVAKKETAALLEKAQSHVSSVEQKFSERASDIKTYIKQALS